MIFLFYISKIINMCYYWIFLTWWINQPRPHIAYNTNEINFNFKSYTLEILNITPNNTILCLSEEVLLTIHQMITKSGWRLFLLPVGHFNGTMLMLKTSDYPIYPLGIWRGMWWSYGRINETKTTRVDYRRNTNWVVSLEG